MPHILRFFGLTSDLSYRGTLSLYFDLGKLDSKVLPDGYDWIYLQDSNSVINRICSPTDWSPNIDLSNQNRSLLAVETAVPHTIAESDLTDLVLTCRDQIATYRLG